MRSNFRNRLSALALLLFGSDSFALTMGDVDAVCRSYAGDCSEIPFLQAYVGGALDFVAMLDEETAYLQPIYCIEASEFFDAPTIIRYMLANQKGYGDKNAMLLVIRFLEERGGCGAR